MKNRFFLLILLCFQPILALKANDSLKLYTIDELVFLSDFEKESFECIRQSTPCDLFRMALATDPAMSSKNYELYKKDFYQFLGQLKVNKSFSKKPKAQIKFIFNAIHDKYFKLYKENPLFSEIFSNGNFNCLTASALFALAFDEFKIPYEIVLSPVHVYLMAYPNNEGIVVETTNPLKGADIVVDPKEKTKIVRELVKMKLVSEEEVSQKGIDKIFSEVYLKNESPDLLQLIGSLYHNQAVAKAGKLAHYEAYQTLKKSSFLFPRKVTVGALMFQSAMFIGKKDIENKETFKVLGEMDKFIPFGLPEQAIIEECNNFLTLAYNNKDKTIFDSVYVWLAGNFSGKNTGLEIANVYFSVKSQIWFEQEQYETAIEKLSVICREYPEDGQLIDLLAEAIFQLLRSIDDSIEILDQINSYGKEFVKLNDNEKYQSTRQLGYLRIIENYYTLHQYKLAEQYRAEFETLFAPETIGGYVSNSFLESVYSRASLYYFRENKISSSRAVLNSGLKYVPNSIDLKSKLNALK